MPLLETLDMEVTQFSMPQLVPHAAARLPRWGSRVRNMRCLTV